MHSVKVASLIAILAIIPLACGPSSPSVKSGSDKVDLLTVSYAGLNAAVAEQKGKVVLIDVWFRG
jgi:hypothetical protein